MSTLPNAEQLKARLKELIESKDQNDATFAYLVDLLLEAYLKGRSDEKAGLETPKAFHDFVNSHQTKCKVVNISVKLTLSGMATLNEIRNSES